MGGVHPQGNKLSAGAPIEDLQVPMQAVFPLSQHIGAPAVPVVKRGDTVKVGTKIADAGGFVSAAIFSSVSGKVRSIEDRPDASGYRKPAIVIDVEGDEWEPSIDRTSTLVTQCSLSAEEIIRCIKEAGIVGMGGACFPTHVKLSPPPGSKAECVVINGVECEPYLTADHRLMVEKPDELLTGIVLLMKAAHVDRAYIGIEANKPDAIRILTEKATKGYPGIKVVPLKVKYPQGGEKQLIKAITGKSVPLPPAIPIQVGVIVQNVGTAYAVYEAVMKHKPLIDRIVTVTGKSLAHPSNFKVRLGTPMSLLIEAAGGMPEDTGKIVAGGPMMGKALPGVDVPVCKGTSGVLLMREAEATRRPAQPCIRCAKCVQACPMGLAPYLLSACGVHADWERAEEELVMSCIECGACQYVCPSAIPLLDYIRLGKNKVGSILRARNPKKS